MDPLGSTRRERLLRRAAGGAAATALLCVGLAALLLPGPGDADALALLAGVALAGAACTVLSWVLEARLPGRRLLLRYAAVGAVAGAAVAVVLGRGVPSAVPLVVAVLLGAAGGALAAGVARRTPARALAPVAVVAVVTTGAVLGVAHTVQRPPAPGSYLVVSAAGSRVEALPLARAVAERLRSSQDPLSDRALSDAAGQVVPPGGAGSVEVGYARLPQARRITVDVDGDRACVLVTRQAVSVRTGGCPV